MKYFNKEAEEIPFETYWALLMDPGYCRIVRHVYGNTDVVTWWVGLQTEFDPLPVLFCTFVRKLEPDENPIRMTTWFTSKCSIENVKKFHLDRAAEVGIPLGRKVKK